MVTKNQGSRITTASTPILRELLTGLDLLWLKFSPVYLGLGVPRGHGEGVLVVPGHRANDFYLLEMISWLSRIGYVVWPSGIRWNNECPNLIVDQLVEKILKLAGQTKKPVRMVGHSLGGMQAAAAARRANRQQPGSVASITQIGTPQREEIRVNPLMFLSIEETRRQIQREGGRTGCYGAGCDCSFADHARDPEVPCASIYTPDDGIVVGEDCKQMGGEDQYNYPVNASGHIALVFNLQVYRRLAWTLQEPETWKPGVTA